MFHSSAGGMTDVEAAHFKEPFLHKYILLWICNRTLEYSSRGEPRHRELRGTACFGRVSDALNVGPGAAAHMSLHLTNNVKERKRPTPSVTLFLEGDPCAEILVTAEANRVARRCGEGAYMGRVSGRQRLFAFLFQTAVKLPEIRALRAGNGGRV